MVFFDRDIKEKETVARSLLLQVTRAPQPLGWQRSSQPVEISAGLGSPQTEGRHATVLFF